MSTQLFYWNIREVFCSNLAGMVQTSFCSDQSSSTRMGWWWRPWLRSLSSISSRYTTIIAGTLHTTWHVSQDLMFVVNYNYFLLLGEISNHLLLGIQFYLTDLFLDNKEIFKVSWCSPLFKPLILVWNQSKILLWKKLKFCPVQLIWLGCTGVL